MATAIRNNVGVGEDALRQIEKQFRLTNRASNYAIYDFNWFCRQFESTYSHIHIEQQINIDESEVPDSLKTVIFRIFQEAMNNIAKHSKADDIHLLFRKTDGAIELGIQDNGEGFDPEEALDRIGTNRGSGLSSMRERTELSGGFFLIESSKMTGTVIRAKWLLQEILMKQG